MPSGFPRRAFTLPRPLRLQGKLNASVFTRSHPLRCIQPVKAMLNASGGHDAAIGFNWDTLQYAIDRVKAR